MPTFTGTTGPDDINGSEQDDLIDGRGGADRIFGRGGADQIRGVVGAVEVSGGAGDDTVIVEWNGQTAGVTLIDGGDGIDTLDLRGVLSSSSATGQIAVDQVLSVLRASFTQGTATFNLSELRSIERIIGPNGAVNWNFPVPRELVFIQAGSGADTFLVGGITTLRGGGGSDTFTLLTGNTAFGESGDDTFLLGDGVTANFDGGEGRDTLVASLAVGANPVLVELATGLGIGNALFSSIENLTLTSTGGLTGALYQLDVLGTDGANVIRVGRNFNEAGRVFGVIRAYDGNDIVETSGADYTVFGGLGDDFINSITAFGEEGDDTLLGIRLDGGDGDDVLVLQAGGERALGGAGYDTLMFGEGVQAVTVSLASGSFAMTTATGPTTGIVSGIESVIGSAGNDTIILSTGSEYAAGGAGADLIRGDFGDDVIYGDEGDDQLFGEGGDDFLIGGAGADQLLGGAGDDRLEGEAGSNTLDGGDGFDTAVYGVARSAVTITYADGRILIDTATGRDTLSGVEFVQFSDGVYRVVGGQLAATPRAAIAGTAAADTLIGTDGADTLSGAAGNDILRGGAGSDLIDGGAGIDTARYSGLLNSYSSVGATRVSGGPEGGADTLISVEALQFLDGRLTFDVSDAYATVYRLYDAAFDRAPDSFGLADYGRALAAGQTTVQQILNAFAASGEFQARYGGLSNESYVREMYRFSLNRDGDAAGVALYVDALNSGALTRAQLLGVFSESQEHRAFIDQRIASDGLFIQDEATLSVARLYDSVLGRVPDLGGLQTYRTALEQGFTLKDVANVLIASSEFQQQFGGLSNQQFVEQIYRFVLDREGDATGIATYVQALNQGFTRADVVLVLSESLEHRLAYQATFDNVIRNLAAASASASPEEIGGKDADVALVLPSLHDGANSGADQGLLASHHAALGQDHMLTDLWQADVSFVHDPLGSDYFLVH